MANFLSLLRQECVGNHQREREREGGRGLGDLLFAHQLTAHIRNWNALLRMVFAEYALGFTLDISGFTVGITRIISENKDYIAQTCVPLA